MYRINKSWNGMRIRIQNNCKEHIMEIKEREMEIKFKREWQIDGKDMSEWITHRRHVLLCTCMNPNHSMTFTYFKDGEVIDDEPTMFVTFKLSTHQNVFKRIFTAIKYVLGMNTSPYGEYDEILFSPQEGKELFEYLEKYLLVYNKYLEKLRK
jgi:hypothetical protein